MQTGSLVDVCQLDTGLLLDFGDGHHLVLELGVAALGHRIVTFPWPHLWVGKISQRRMMRHSVWRFVEREDLAEADDETLHVAFVGREDPRRDG